MTSWMDSFWIGLGSACGGILRYWLTAWIAHRLLDPFPYGTVIVNALGSFFIGFIACFAVGDGLLLLETRWRDFLMIGLLGGFTTFSSFSLQTLNLFQAGNLFSALLNIGNTLFFCLLGVYLGYLLGSTINGSS